MVRERTQEATRHAEHLRSVVDGAVQGARDSRSSEVRLHLPTLPRSCQRHTHTQPDLIPPTLPPPALGPCLCHLPGASFDRISRLLQGQLARGRDLASPDQDVKEA